MKTRIAIACVAVAAVAVAGIGGFAAAASGNDKDAKEHVVVISYGIRWATPGSRCTRLVLSTGAPTVKPDQRHAATSGRSPTARSTSSTSRSTRTTSSIPRRALARSDESGTWKVVSGTGAYAHAEGHGTYI